MDDWCHEIRANDYIDEANLCLLFILFCFTYDLFTVTWTYIMPFKKPTDSLPIRATQNNNNYKIIIIK